MAVPVVPLRRVVSALSVGSIEHEALSAVARAAVASGRDRRTLDVLGGTTWRQLTMRFVADDVVAVVVAGTRRRLSATDFGLNDNRRSTLVLGEPALPDIVVPPSLARSPGILGSSPALRRVLTLAARYAPTHRSVLITGETGAGKERLARTVHDASGRTVDYVVDSCANLSAELFESELFGHEKGWFTGATATSGGLAMAATDCGTLFLDEFLDEVGELVLPQQAKPPPSSRSAPSAASASARST